MPFDLVIDEETSWGEEVERLAEQRLRELGRGRRATSRYFSDRFGRARGSIEGTQLPYELVWQHASEAGELVYDPGHRRAPLRLSARASTTASSWTRSRRRARHWRRPWPPAPPTIRT
jgi:hypothetical protein